ncbi:MAG: SHOCT domain-containing protein [Chloroflexi bacterium]|nr:SHOCT domain-containing protein [Chloroflexota bacterium]
MWCGGHEGIGWWPVVGGVFMLLFWGGIVALVIWGISRMARGRGCGPGSREGGPLDIAKNRYARGEISREEFEQIKKDLS